MCLEAHYICMAKYEFQHTALVSCNVWYSYKYVLPCSDSGELECEKSGEAVSKSLFYMGYQVNIMQCTQPNLLLTGKVYPMLMSSVPHAWGTLDRKSTLFELIVKFFLKGIFFMFWHDVVYIELLYCVTNLELAWTWNKVAVVENAKRCWLYPTFPYLFMARLSFVHGSQSRSALRCPFCLPRCVEGAKCGIQLWIAGGRDCREYFEWAPLL